MIHLAHLSQVDCQFGSSPKPLQNNNLQFDACLFKSTWLTLRTDTGEENCGKMCELVSPERYAVCHDGEGRMVRILSPLPKPGGLVRGARGDELGVGPDRVHAVILQADPFSRFFLATPFNH